MIRYFAGHRTAANLLMVAFIAAGLLTLPGLVRETFPDFSAGLVQVQVIYPGASAEDVEEAVCGRIEDAIDGIDGVAELRSEAREGLGLVTAEMIESQDVQRFLAEIKREVDAITDLPELAEPPTVSELGWADPVVSIAVGGGGMAERDLKAYCEDLKDRLRLATGVRLVDIDGFSQHQLRVEVSAEALQRFGISAGEIADVIGAQSVDVPAGTITSPAGEVLVRFTDERRTPRELSQLVVVSSDSGGEVLLGDIADIRDVFELDEERILLDGERAGLLNVKKTRAEDALDIVGAVRAFLDDERQLAPPGVRLVLTQDVASIVSDRLRMLVKNGWQGMALVFVVLALFFALRFAFWVALGVPVSFLGALFVMQQTGMTLNMMTMVGLLLALGLLMDDAIVLSENIAAQRQAGKGVLASAIDGAKEVRVGVISSFATTCCIFLPLSFLEGDMGKVLRVMPVVLILVLGVSLIEAFLILPNHLSHALAHYRPEARGRVRGALDRGLELLRERVLGRTVDLAVRWRWLTLGLIVFAFLASVAQVAGGRLKFRAFPDVDGDVVEARVLMPQGTPLVRTEEVVAQLEAALARVNAEFAPRQPDGQPLVRTVLTMFNDNPDASESGPHVARVVVDLLSSEVRDARLADFKNRWREETGPIPGVLSLKFTEPSFGPAGRPLELRLSGDDLEELKSASYEVLGWLGSFDGVLDLSDDLRPGKPEYRLSLREGASGLGLDAQRVASQVRAALHGRTAREFQLGKESYEVDVRIAPGDRERITDLELLSVTLPGGQQIPLPAVANIEDGRGYARIARVDGRRTVTITGDVDTERLNTAELLTALRADLLPELRERHPNVAVDMEGEAKETARTQASMLRALAIGVLGVFLLLSFQFQSYVEPLIVMTAIPMCLIGVIWGHVLMGLDLTMPSLFGLVSLAGVVVNDSILLVEFIKLRRREGLDATTAARTASRQRFRAVLLTSLTTVLGLTPLMLEKSLQAQFLIPLAASIVFGLLASTVLVLVALPALYGVLEDLGLTAPIEPEPST